MNPKSNTPPAPPSLEEGLARDCVPRVVESRDLLAGESEVLIRHAGRTYRLRRTRLGKLILTA